MPVDRARKSVPVITVLITLLVLYVAGQSAVAAGDADQTAQPYKFRELPIPLPEGYADKPMKNLRQVNPGYEHIAAWISGIGASVAINDLTGHGRADSLCLVDPRTDDVIVTYTPTAPQEDRFAPFVLDPAPLPYDRTMAPTGCTPGDFNVDGRMDLLITYWGRTPILFLAKADATTVGNAAYQRQELVPNESLDGRYHGPKWNTDAIHVGDYDGDARPDVFIGNYFPDSDVLDPDGLKNVEMNLSMSSATNGGGGHVLRWLSATSGPTPSASYVPEPKAIPYDAATGWTLSASGADLDGDGLTELYIGNDFGHDHLLHNRSEPGEIRFAVTKGSGSPLTPKSFKMGDDSFKGMGVDFADPGGKGRFDLMVSNITSAWGLQESNFFWENQTSGNEDMRARLSAGEAPFKQRAEDYGLAWTGWCWDVKFGDFLNNGDLAVVQSDGFIKGERNRWNWLQELAMINDVLMSNPAMWPNMKEGDDLAGDDVLAFYAKGADGRYVNISEQLGFDEEIPSRAIATGDTTGTGALDFAVARQWGPSSFYANEAPDRGEALSLALYQPAVGGGAAGSGLSGIGAPAYGTTVTIKTSDGRTQASHLDGGGGHSGFRSFEVRFGLGEAAGPVEATINWRDADGRLHNQTVGLAPGAHSLVLSNTVQEVSPR
ncbi:ASPIC/UnbV domain-containing protein [Umezawaea sp. Da 62-37]|uniref:ASPIC/UnbV domain-containing protein n=1 Tax=Umezawaea sp. Da 62-37 TaxID=3075927 RepID=UPI0028F6C478|nr:ASPIC/UnbV domain-containing protein [Umezawaea sp. Da 62-37]WNV84565.1 ASPIC/UnbV domain-containing protein [Umezawaea sp. Da 62-37]